MKTRIMPTSGCLSLTLLSLWVTISLTTIDAFAPSVNNGAIRRDRTTITIQPRTTTILSVANEKEIPPPTVSLDGKRVYFEQKAEGRSHNESYQLDPVTKKAEKLAKEQQLAKASASAKFNPAESHGVFTFQNNLYSTCIYP